MEERIEERMEGWKDGRREGKEEGGKEYECMQLCDCKMEPAIVGLSGFFTVYVTC